ncbi:MAG: VCBS repeat-containing protein [Planctomycetota bacterium]
MLAPISVSQDANASLDATISMSDVSATSGINFKHFDGSKGEFFIIESLSAGIALFDFDGDGDDDLLLLNGASLDGLKGMPNKESPEHSNALYRNDGDFQFTNITNQCGLGDLGFGLGVAVGDYDNDGAPDVFINNGGANVLYHNNLDGTFSATPVPVSLQEQRIGAGASFLDIDQDGDLDLFVANYVREDFKNHKVHYFKGLPDYPSPLSLPPEADQLFENLGDGTFQDISDASQITEFSGRGMGVLTFDFDGDEDIDIFVANDSEQNFLYENIGNNKFQESSLIAGLAYDYKANPQASMGVDLLDLDADRQLDLFVTSFSREFATYYRNDGGGFFVDRTLQTGSSKSTFSDVTWGVVAGDYNNDGSVDVFVAAGDLDEQNSSRGGTGSTGYRAQNFMLQGSNDGKLKDLGDGWGEAAKSKESSRGAGSADLNRDGQLDLVVLNSRKGAQILKNDGASKNFLRIRLVGTNSNREGLGAVISITQGGFTQSTQTRSSHSYQSESSHILHFGLKSDSEDVEVIVRWLGSSMDSKRTFLPGQSVTIIEESQE